MKVTPEQILITKNKELIQKKIFLICGNEQSLISRIEKEVVNDLELINYTNIQKIEGGSVNHEIERFFSGTLFGGSSILIFYNPKDVDIDYLATIDITNIAIIICHNNLKNSSKIKINFEKKNYLVSVACYKLSKENKKLYFDNLISKNNILLEKEAYWFFLDNSGELYQIFENEITKLINFDDKKIELSDVRLVLSEVSTTDLEKVFFLLLKTPKEIILKTSSVFKNSSESLTALYQIKYFIGILSGARNISDIDSSFPRYLFKEKPIFKSIFNKINSKKISKIYGLIKKTEILLKKHNTLSIPISQRFLINLSKYIR